MAQRKAAVAGKEVQALKLPDVLALRAKITAGNASTEERELFQRLAAFWRSRYQSGALSERTAQQLGIA